MNALNRMPWIDWMKAGGMYFIVLGHFFSIGNAYVYVFNVPLFFIISGFLYKHEKDALEFWKKLWWNLIVPMLIMCCINFLFNTILNLRHGLFDWQNTIKFIPQIIFGFHSGVGVCWFIYTLALIKILFHYIRDKTIRLLLVIVGLTIAYILHNKEYPIISGIQNASNAIFNVCTALPFFFIGCYLRKYKEDLNMIKNKGTLLLLLCIGTIYLYISGHYNGGYVWMYINRYGNDIYWFIIGGLAGTLVVFSLSKFMDFSNRYIETISRGTIIILGFHMHLIRLIIRLIRHYFPVPFMDFFYSLLIIIAFIPVIIAINKYCPILLGKYRASQST